MVADASASFALPFPIDVALTLGPLQRGESDPTIRLDRQAAWRAARTPDGAATVRLSNSGNRLEASAWGPGAGWLVEHTADWLGFDDDPGTFRPRPGLVRELHRRHGGLRLGRTGLVFEALLPTILEQKVPGVQAWRSYDRLVRALGEPAPGGAGLYLQPSPGRLLETPYWTVHRLGIEQRRFSAIQYAAARAAGLESTVNRPPHEARRNLMSLPGIGSWTAAEVSVAAYGDRDAVSLGDYHLPHQVAWALAGEPRGSDARMIELLSPYAGHRARVIRLLALSGIQAPRFGPRMALRDIRRI